MVWDPVKPFKCECPKNYDGEFCETCKLKRNVEIEGGPLCFNMNSRGV